MPYLITPYAETAGGTTTTLPRVPVSGGILTALTEIRTWATAGEIAAAQIARNGELVAHLLAEDFEQTAEDFTYSPAPAGAGGEDRQPARTAANLMNAAFLAAAWLAATTIPARVDIHRADTLALSVDRADFCGLAGTAAPGSWPDWQTWQHHPPSTYVTAVANELADCYGWTIAETSDHGFRVDLAESPEEPNARWTGSTTDADQWWATFTPGRAWEYGMKLFQHDNSPSRAPPPRRPRCPAGGRRVPRRRPEPRTGVHLRGADVRRRERARPRLTPRRHRSRDPAGPCHRPGHSQAAPASPTSLAALHPADRHQAP